MEIAYTDMKLIRKVLRDRQEKIEGWIHIYGGVDAQLQQERNDCKRLADAFDALILQQ